MYNMSLELTHSGLVLRKYNPKLVFQFKFLQCPENFIGGFLLLLICACNANNKAVMKKTLKCMLYSKLIK